MIFYSVMRTKSMNYVKNVWNICAAFLSTKTNKTLKIKTLQFYILAKTLFIRRASRCKRTNVRFVRLYLPYKPRK